MVAFFKVFFLVAQASRLCFLPHLIEPWVIFRELCKAAFYGIISDVVPFLQEFGFIPDNAIIPFYLPNRTGGTAEAVNIMTGKALDAVQDLPQVNNPACGMSLGLR
jgi:hypothetical protein